MLRSLLNCRKVKMNITLVGAGNMGLALTAYLSINRKADVTLFTKREIGLLRFQDVEKKIQRETNAYTTSENPEEAFSNADMILVTYPAFLRKKFIEENQDYIHSGTYLGFVPGYGGAEYSCKELLEKGVVIFGFQRVPYVARASQDENGGYVASVLSSKKQLFIGAIPNSKTSEIANVIEGLLDIPVVNLKEYLSITLAPSNPLMHITGLYNVFKDYTNGQVFSTPLKFYEEWNDEASKLLFAYDAELQNICKQLSPLDMSEVVSLPVYYESPTPEDMTRKLKSIESFKAVTVPLKQTQEGYIPDLSSRMFIEDYPFGVCVIKDFARMLGVDTPVVDLLLEFYERLSGHKYFRPDGSYTEEIAATGIPGIHGIHSKDGLISFYHR